MNILLILPAALRTIGREVWATGRGVAIALFSGKRIEGWNFKRRSYSHAAIALELP
jgi:hypothetical protein